MKININKFKLSVLVPLIIVLTFPLIAFAASSDFLSKAQQYFSRECNNRASREEGMICYVYEKVREDDQRDATQSAKIAEIESRIAALENPPSPSPSPSPQPEINQILDFNQTFDIPEGYNTMVIEVQQQAPLSFPWAPAPSFDNGNSYVEQHRYHSGIDNATIPIVSTKYRINSGAATSIKVRVILRDDENAEVIIFGQNASYPFTSTPFNPSGYNSINITASGGNNPQNINAIVLQRDFSGTFSEVARTTCDGGAECPAANHGFGGSSNHRIVIEGSGSGALFAGLLHN